MEHVFNILYKVKLPRGVPDTSDDVCGGPRSSNQSVRVTYTIRQNFHFGIDWKIRFPNVLLRRRASGQSSHNVDSIFVTRRLKLLNRSEYIQQATAACPDADRKST